MVEIENVLQEFPAESRQSIAALWQALPAAQRSELLTLLPMLPGQPGKVRKLFELAHQQMQMSFGDKQQVVIVGPANVGKSTLYNKLVAAKGDHAEVGPIPGTTRANQSGSAGPFVVIDTPGADAVGAVGERERALALQAAAAADFLVILFDAVQGVKQTEQALFRQLQALHKPYIVALNKMDLIRRHKEAVVAKAAENLGIEASMILPISAEEGDNLAEVVLAIVKAEPALVAALGQGLPAYRWQLAWRVITGAASTSALVALTPLPFVDFLPLVAIQGSMILGIARIYEYELTAARARELVGVLGGGFLARTLFYELTKIGGPPTWVLASAVAAGTTVSMGYAAIVWFERGERLTKEAARSVAGTVTSYLVDTLKNLGRRRPSRRGLAQQVREALEKSPLGRDRTGMDAAAQATNDTPGT